VKSTSSNSSLTHVNAEGNAQIVDVTDRVVTVRTAKVKGKVLHSEQVRNLIAENAVSKGNVIDVSRIAAIMGAKKTSELIPLCHPLAITGIEIEYVLLEDGIEISAFVKTTDRTGVEMEAFTAVAVGALAVIDMIKSIDSYASITEIRLVEKSGGKNGDWTRN